MYPNVSKHLEMFKCQSSVQVLVGGTVKVTSQKQNIICNE